LGQDKSVLFSPPQILPARAVLLFWALVRERPDTGRWNPAPVLVDRVFGGQLVDAVGDGRRVPVMAVIEHAVEDEHFAGHAVPGDVVVQRRGAWVLPAECPTPVLHRAIDAAIVELGAFQLPRRLGADEIVTSETGPDSLRRDNHQCMPVT